MFSALRQVLLGDCFRERFGMLLAQRKWTPGGREVFVVREVVLAGQDDLTSSSLCQAHPTRDFVARVLARVQANPAVNAVIDVHTHPFSGATFFSCTDDADERRFSRWLRKFNSKLGYASILLSAGAWKARVWRDGQAFQALVNPQSALKGVPHVLPARLEAVGPKMPVRTAPTPVYPVAPDWHTVPAGVDGIGHVLADEPAHPGFTRTGPDYAGLPDLACLGDFRDGTCRPKADATKNLRIRVSPEAEATPHACDVNLQAPYRPPALSRPGQPWRPVRHLSLQWPRRQRRSAGWLARHIRSSCSSASKLDRHSLPRVYREDAGSMRTCIGVRRRWA